MSFNKKSRYHEKLTETLIKTADYYPCFDWQFPPLQIASQPFEKNIFVEKI
jgi:hypothetical protein